MPWTPKQKKAIRAKKHGWDPPGDDEPFANVPFKKLSEMEKEPTKKEKALPFKKGKGKKKNLSAQMAALKS